MKEQELSAWLSLSLTPNISNKSIHHLLSQFGNAVRVFQDETTQGLKEKEILMLAKHCRTHRIRPEITKKVRQALDWRQDNQRHIIPLHDNRYPALLKEIPDPPILLLRVLWRL